jgi:hypothetical protein
MLRASFANTLWQGARDPAVRNLQARLIERGRYFGLVDGIFWASYSPRGLAFQKAIAHLVYGRVVRSTLHLPSSRVTKGTIRGQSDPVRAERVL